MLAEKASLYPNFLTISVDVFYFDKSRAGKKTDPIHTPSSFSRCQGPLILELSSMLIPPSYQVHLQSASIKTLISGCPTHKHLPMQSYLAIAAHLPQESNVVVQQMFASVKLAANIWGFILIYLLELYPAFSSRSMRHNKYMTLCLPFFLQ